MGLCFMVRVAEPPFGCQQILSAIPSLDTAIQRRFEMSVSRV